MSKQTSFAYQKQVLEDLLSCISSFENDIKDVISRYEEEIMLLYEEKGLMDEIFQDYNNAYLQTMKSSLLDVVSRIPEEDIPFVEKEIDFIASR